jgi:hypothetical protein
MINHPQESIERVGWPAFQCKQTSGPAEYAGSTLRGTVPVEFELAGIAVLHLHQFQEFVAAGTVELALGVKPRCGFQFR